MAAAGFRVAPLADFSAAPSFALEEASNRDDGWIEVAPSISISTVATFRALALRALGISLCLLIATLGKDQIQFKRTGSNLPLVLR